ncbi:MAG: sodium/proline symporter [Clostridia bacterium]|nr:sodium/proline symporter [Clostridia bacterium]
MNVGEIIAFIAYFVIVLAVGVYFFLKSRGAGEKEYFLGGRNMGGLVAALSAGASDMSAWVLMGLPGAICLLGMGQVWISIGLIIGTICAWIFVAPKLRRYAIKANDSITIPEYLSNRFKSKNNVLRITCAVIFVIAYCIYAASSISACGTLFQTVTGGAITKTWGMIIAAVVIGVYTLLGGFNAVCWTDFFQGLLMLAALMVLPIIALFVINSDKFVAIGQVVTPENYMSLLSSGKFDGRSIIDIISGLGWGLGYFGMPHILVRYMSIKSEKEMRKSQIVGSVWTTVICIMASVVGLVAHKFFGSFINGGNSEQVFIMLARFIVPGVLSGILISAIMAASMSTADSQLLASSSAFASDIYKTAIKKNASDKHLLMVGRIAVAVILAVALVIALLPGSGGIMDLVSNAWAIFGSAFGPVILLSLYFRKLNYAGAVSSIISGFGVSVLWTYVIGKYLLPIGLYEIIPGFAVAFIVAIVVSLLTKQPSKEVLDEFDEVKTITYKSEN